MSFVEPSRVCQTQASRATTISTFPSARTIRACWCPTTFGKNIPTKSRSCCSTNFGALPSVKDSFEITLSFNGVHELLSVPFGAITGFVDPSVRFGLQFQVDGDDDDESAESGSITGSNEIPNAMDLGDLPIEVPEAGSDTSEGENIVTLDQFRKK